jgi:actin related protein 2/3 complex subunit 3
LSDVALLGNIAVLPLKTKTRGFAPVITDVNQEDIIDEALSYFRANCLFKNFEIQGPADRILIYLILFISECLSKLSMKPTREEALKCLTTLAVGSFAIPGDGGFPLNALYESPTTRAEVGAIFSVLFFGEYAFVFRNAGCGFLASHYCNR